MFVNAGKNRRTRSSVENRDFSRGVGSVGSLSKQAGWLVASYKSEAVLVVPLKPCKDLSLNEKPPIPFSLTSNAYVCWSPLLLIAAGGVGGGSWDSGRFSWNASGLSWT